MKCVVYISDKDIRHDIFKEYNIDESDMRINEYGKPILNDSKINFNISHSEGIFLMALSSEMIGIDIEKVRDIDYIGISKRIFKEEIKSSEEFFKRWVKHEAKVKLLGESIFRNDDTLKDDNIKYTKIDIIEGAYIYLASFKELEVEVRIC